MKYKNSIDELKDAIKNNKSWAGVCRTLNRKERTGNQSHLKNTAIKLGIDFSHFTGKGWNKGQIFEKKNINLYLNNEIRINSHKLKQKLIVTGLKKNECEICKLSEWRNEELVLELDHIDSNHKNNNLENLQIICPNCHALETRRRLKKSKVTKVDKRKNHIKKERLRKIKDRPSLKNLLLDVEKLGYRGTGRKYGVSDNCIRKWIKWETAGTVDNSVLETEAK